MRLPKDDFFMKLAYEYAEQSTCTRRKVGAVIVRDGRILSAGYNGAPSGIKHCRKETCIRTKLNIPSGERQEMCVTGDTVIKLLNGQYKTIRELADNGEDVWVYSIDTETGQIVPGYAINPHLTGYRNDIVEIEFDNGKTLRCTSDHKILLRNCEYKEAGKLQYGDSCMPIYYNKGKDNDSHEIIHNTRPDSRNFKFEDEWKCNTKTITTHEMVYRSFYDYNGELGKNSYDIHHDDFNKFNNTPENLKLLTHSEHISIHGKTKVEHLRQVSKLGTLKIKNKALTDDSFRAKLSNGGKTSMNNNWNNLELRERMSKVNSENGKKIVIKTNSDKDCIIQTNKDKIQKGLSYLIFKCKENNENITLQNYELLRNKYKKNYKVGDKGQSPPTLKYINKYYLSLENALEEAKYYNHKVIKVTKLDILEPVYDLSVPDYENFAISLGDNSCVVISNCIGGHAEQNAIANAAENGVAIKDSILYCTTYPCAYCAKAIIRAGIKKVVYDEGYPDELSSYLLQNIEIVKYEKEEI